MEVPECEMVVVKFDSGNDDVWPGIDPIELTQNDTQAPSKMQEFAQNEQISGISQKSVCCFFGTCLLEFVSEILSREAGMAHVI